MKRLDGKKESERNNLEGPVVLTWPRTQQSRNTESTQKCACESMGHD